MSTIPRSILYITGATACAALLSACPSRDATNGADAAEAGGAFPGIVQVCADALPVPTGFDYPQTAATVEQWVAARDAARARVHGWNLWAALNTAPASVPVWRSWCTSSQAFAASSGGGGGGGSLGAVGDGAARRHGQDAMLAMDFRNGPTTGEDPINFPHPPYYPVPAAIQQRYSQCYNSGNGQLRDGPTFQNNGDIMVAGVIYNSPAYDWIRNNNLYLASTLQGMLPGLGQRGGIGAFPSGSIVLKPMMWPVRGDGLTALPIWDGPASDNGRYAGYEVQGMWPRAVAIGGAPQSEIATADVTYLHGVWTNNMLGRRQLGPLTYRQAPVVPLERFYHFTFPSLEGLHPCDRAILDASAYWAYGREFRAGDALALVAMHIMTKEQPAWTFQSVWWHDRPDQGPYAADRPDIPAAQAPGPWRHYLMTSTYGIAAEPRGTSWPIAYNPYIELAAAHPIRTNCMNCHHRAAWTSRQSPAPTPSYEAASPPGPDALAVFDFNNPIFNGLLGVDSLWSVNDRAVGPASQGAPARPGTPGRSR